MPKKPLTPEAAQRKVWMAERKTIAANIIKIERDCQRECKSIRKQMAKLHKQLERANRAAERAMAPAFRRMAILDGRVGLP